MAQWDDLADHLRATLPATIGGLPYSVYAGDVDLVKLPAIVCKPGDPLFALDSMGGGRVRWSLECQLWFTRSNPVAADAWIAEAAQEVFAACVGTPFWFQQCGGIDTGTVNNQDAAQATCTIDAIMQA